MNVAKLFFSAEGRLGRKGYWLGALALVVTQLLLLLIPYLGLLLFCALVYCWICVHVKRLHDTRRTGLIILIPVALHLLLAIVGAVLLMSQNEGKASVDTASATFGYGFGQTLVYAVVAVWPLFMLIIGLPRSDLADNRFGPGAGDPAQILVDTFS